MTTSTSPPPNHPSTQAPAPKPLSPSNLRVVGWPDPVVDNLGHDPRSRYVERYWLGVLGPSTTWLLRHVADKLERDPQGFDMPLRETAMALGLGMREGRHSPFLRAIDRTCQFGLARKPDAATLEIRRHLPPVTQGQLKRLPDAVQLSHAAWRRAQLRTTDATAERKARRLALTLLELGEDVDAAERQLQHWRVDPATAQRALSWAHERHCQALAAASRQPGPEAA